MSPEGIPDWIFFFPVIWIGGVTAASILYRRAVGKPIFPKRPEYSTFYQGGASGWNDSQFLGSFSGASGCLLVATTDQELVISPQFPFNLLFLPEILGLEIRAPLSRIRHVERTRRVLSDVLIVHLHDGKRIGLRLRAPEDFERAVSR